MRHSWFGCSLGSSSREKLCRAIRSPMRLTILFLASTAQAVEVTYFLKQGRPHAVREALERVSDPTSPQWGQFLTHEAVAQLQRPSDYHIESVSAHLRTLGVTEARWSTAYDKVIVEVPTTLEYAALMPRSIESAVDVTPQSSEPTPS